MGGTFCAGVAPGYSIDPLGKSSTFSALRLTPERFAKPGKGRTAEQVRLVFSALRTFLAPIIDRIRTHLLVAQKLFWRLEADAPTRVSIAP